MAQVKPYFVRCPVCKEGIKEFYLTKGEILGKIKKCECIGGGKKVKFFVEEKHIWKMNLEHTKDTISGIQKKD